MNQIWFPDASARHHAAGIAAAFERVLRSGIFIMGDEVSAFESEFSAAQDARHAIGVASGTDAIELSLRAAGLGRGDRVATVSHTAVATVAAIYRAGLEPVLVDVVSKTYTMDPESLDLALRSDAGRGVRAVVPVHLYGHPADMTRIADVARAHGICIIEDCAQSHLAKWKGRFAGTFGVASAFSFYPTKNLGALGDGGAILTDSDAMAERLKSLRQYGWRERYISSEVGCNSRLDEIQASVLRVKLKTLSEETRARRALARLYDETLAGLPAALPWVHPDVEHSYHLYVIQIDRRDDVLTRMRARGVPVQVHYPLPVHLQPAYVGSVRVVPGGLPVTEALAGRLLTLPLHPFMGEGEIAMVCQALRECIAG
ncbi:MAG: DegT/DnrJ/EryC1/StrS family aminotransferase [Candidatus Hydrogenedentes bacterium]|nr:DegT/DnrJ/EryC1/StrS family aminotransferase [Candidatus Hydrogenedentota bacterium]